ncbi:pilus assembly protein PilM [Ruminococcus sp. FC2018]|uniref:pilus assembly protein PilM n=1 Tax=Ruminococcus sp. FC2018 TaxID=1410617 RepID=UPI0006867FA8|nr:pilus assembly protein PilM [Ruminococcus sp. FC2018]
MLSFDISDRQINVVKGDNVANKIKIEKSLTIDIPEDMILNGEVINLSGLNEIISSNLRSNMMADKDAVVTFSSSNIVFKELIVPKGKGSEFLTMVQNQMAQEMGLSDDYSISYTVVGEAGADNPGAVKVLATACPSTIVDSFRKLFSVLGISLKSVNIGCNSISRIVLADKSNLDKMPLLVCQIDENFLGLTLFENGQMAFARYVPISPDDYESEDYIMEALNENIFRMEQFNKARGGSGLSNVILYGRIEDYIKIVDALDGLDIKASVLSVPTQITGYENFEFTVYANAIGALYKRDKQTERINLLEVDQMQGKGGGVISQTLLTGLIVAGASAILIILIVVFVGIARGGVEDDIEKTESDIVVANKKIAENKVLHDKLNLIEQWNMFVDGAKTNIETIPFMNQERFDEVKRIMKEQKATYTGFNYDEETGTIVLSDVAVDTQKDVKKLCDAFQDSKYVAYVLYSGYEGVGAEVDSSGNPVSSKASTDESSEAKPNEGKVVIKTLTLNLKGTGEVK